MNQVSTNQIRVNQGICPERRWQRHWCAVVVLVAVCALTVSVATRYCSLGSSLASTASVQKQSPPEPGRQRLLKSAPAWQPPVVSSALLWAPTFYARVVPARPTAPSVVFEEWLYNRPPPSSDTLS